MGDSAEEGVKRRSLFVQFRAFLPSTNSHIGVVILIQMAHFGRRVAETVWLHGERRTLGHRSTAESEATAQPPSCHDHRQQEHAILLVPTDSVDDRLPRIGRLGTDEIHVEPADLALMSA